MINKLPAKKVVKANKNIKSRKQVLARNKKASFLLNEKEYEALEAYCKKYKVKNRGQFLRETVMQLVMNRFMDDYPTLFDKEDLDKLKI